MTNDELRELCNGILKGFASDREMCGLAQAWLAEHPEPTGPTKRIRAACIINADGQYAVTGWSTTKTPSDDEMQENVSFYFHDILENHERFHWIEADVPVPVVPQSQTIIGTVDPKP